MGLVVSYDGRNMENIEFHVLSYLLGYTEKMRQISIHHDFSWSNGHRQKFKQSSSLINTKYLNDSLVPISQNNQTEAEDQAQVYECIYFANLTILKALIYLFTL